jgi:hypothetical protein
MVEFVHDRRLAGGYDDPERKAVLAALRGIGASAIVVATTDGEAKQAAALPTA